MKLQEFDLEVHSHAPVLACRYDPEFVPNQSDDTGRYRYEEQPAACYWNCEKLAEGLKAVLSKGRALSWLQSNFYLTYQR